MPTAEARIATNRASRYLVQLCSHLNHMSGMRHQPPAGHGAGHMPPKVEHVDHSDSYGTIRFTHGLCTLRATADSLKLRLDADDDETLQRLQNGLAGRIEKFGRRDQLTVTWSRPEASDIPPHKPTSTAGGPEAAAAGRRRHTRSMTTAALWASGAVVVAVHLFGGAGLAAVTWLKWGADAVLVLIALKLVLVGAHLLAGRYALRHGKTLKFRGIPGHSPVKSLKLPRMSRHHAASAAETAANEITAINGST
jgi:hypothetical protein